MAERDPTLTVDKRAESFLSDGVDQQEACDKHHRRSKRDDCIGALPSFRDREGRRYRAARRSSLRMRWS
jgi:hypothetical protein